MKPVSVLLIGLGRVGSRFYEKFRELGESRVRIAGVCEVDSRHPLVQRAREAGVPVYEDFRSALTHSDNPVDIVLDTTNLPEVKDQLRRKPGTITRYSFRSSRPISSGTWLLQRTTCRRIMRIPVTDPVA